MSWETVIGLEIHAQLATSSKIFSGAQVGFGASPNTQACTVDLGLPGTLPVPNSRAIYMALRFGLAINAKIAETTVFYRKNYFYPDLPKGYQISQLDQPIVGPGTLHLADGSEHTLEIVRAHLEEDAGKSMHENMQGMTGIDLNRAGTPLLEIVTAPDIRSPKEASAWMRRIHHIVHYLGICSGAMEEGALRCDANISVRPLGQESLGERVEIKNLNSFKFVEQALAFEANRQIRNLEQGHEIVRETRLYNTEKQETRSMRSKEYAEDYRYFPEPDLPPLHIDASLVDAVRSNLPELPDIRSTKYQTDYSLPKATADYLCQDCDTADYFDAVVQKCNDAQAGANWIMGELAAVNNSQSVSIANAVVTSSDLATLIERINQNVLSSKMAKEVFHALSEGATSGVDAIIESLGLRQLNDESELQKMVTQVITDHPEQVAQYRSGKTKILGFFVGQVMKMTRGQANPRQLNELLQKQLSEP